MNMPTVIDAARAIRVGAMTSEALTQRCIEAIERHNGLLNAFVHLDVEAALAAARAVDRKIASGAVATLGPLAGIPFGVKDLENCAGMPTTRGSRWFAGDMQTVDDIHVARLRRAGAIPIGKTAVPEFGSWAYTASPLLGVTRNPWNPARTPGGSSGGSSAAVVAGLVPFCTASDGGGSIRTPAAFTGLPGLKPTYGRIPTFGVTHIAQNAVVGCLATTIADTALLLDVMAGPDPRDRTCLPPPPVSYLAALDSDLRGIRAAWSLDLGFAVVEPVVAKLCQTAAEALIAAIGAERVDVRVEVDDYIRTYAKIEGVDRFVNIDPDLWQNRLDELDPLNAPGWERTRTVTLPKSARVEATRRKLVHQIAAYFERFDVLLTPMVCRPAFVAEGPMPTEVAGVTGHGGMAVIHGMLANVANLPAITLPAGLTPDGLPVGLQIVGPRYREDLLLAIARRYELARPWPRHAPLAG